MYDDMPQLVDATLSPLQMGGGFPGSSGAFGGPSIPPPPGATYSGGAGAFGAGSLGYSSNAWANQIDYSSGEYIRNELCIFLLILFVWWQDILDQPPATILTGHL